MVSMTGKTAVDLKKIVARSRVPCVLKAFFGYTATIPAFFPMANSTKKSSAPLTFDLPLDLIAKIKTLRNGHGLKTSSEVVRLAMDNFDFDRCEPNSVPHRQISVRISADQRSKLKRYAKKKDTSVGELLRLALEGLPAKASKKK
jgi:hypothetical protein